MAGLPLRLCSFDVVNPMASGWAVKILWLGCDNFH